MEDHILMGVDSPNSEVENLVTHQNNKFTAFDLVVENDRFEPDFSWKINETKSDLKKDDLEISSELFQWRDYPARSRAKIETNGSKKSFISLCFDEADGFDKLIKSSPILPTVYYLLRDQSQSTEPKHKCREVSCLFGTKSAYPSAFLNFKTQFYSKRHRVDDLIVVDVYVEPPEMAQKVHSFDGTLTYSIDNYSLSKSMEQTWVVNCHESAYFYTGPSGYRVQVHMWLHGWGAKRENGLTAEISFLTGMFDAHLPPTFLHTTTITLLNRKNPDGNISTTVERDIGGGARYTMTVCSKEEIESVIEDDSVFYSVTVKAIESADLILL